MNDIFVLVSIATRCTCNSVCIDSTSRKEDVALPTRYFCIFFSIAGNVAKDKGFPIGKVDRII